MLLFQLIDFYRSYKRSEIKAQTGNGFWRTILNSGNYGEFLCYKELMKISGQKTFIHNCYVPTAEGFTEIDLMMIHETGLYVIESKNYNGWIFGTEKQKNWTQVMPGGRNKFKFYNPIWQNAGHVKALQAHLTEYTDLPVFSYIVFSQRCQLKKVPTNMDHAVVVRRPDLLTYLRQDIVGRTPLDQSVQTALYNCLAPLTQQDEAARQAHVERIKAFS